MDGPEKPSKAQEETPPRIPVEVEVYIAPDGSVTFADLEAGMLPAARELDPDAPSLAALEGQDTEGRDSTDAPEGTDHDNTGAENPA